METAIKELKKKPLSGLEILESCNNEIKVMTYKELSEYKTIDDAFGNKDAIALLYEIKPRYGHWVGVFRHPGYNTIEFYDSYGLFIDDQLSFVPEKFKKQLSEDYPYLSRLLYNSKYDIIYNPVRIQKRQKGISSCGRHVVMRCLTKDIPLNEYLNIIQQNLKITNPDELVTYLTASI